MTPFLLVLFFLLGACSDDRETPFVDLGIPADADEIREITRPPAGRREWQFGFDLRNGPEEDALQYLPLLKYLEQKTGVRFVLKFSNSSLQLLSDLIHDKVDFAAIGAASYLNALPSAPILPLVKGLNADGEAGYRAIVVVTPESPLHRLQDLKGKRLAFGSTSSTQGHWIPRIMLHRAGMSLQDLGSFYFTGSHRACAEAVITHQADACGLQDTLAMRLTAAGKLRQLAVSDLYPSSGIFVRASVPADIRERVRRALIEFDPQGKDQAGLYHWESTEMAGGFVTATRADYETLRAWAEKLGLLGDFMPRLEDRP